jgi:hypothetical protein
VGYYTSIAIGTDGFPVISYYDGTNGYLKVAKCDNASCSTACGAGSVCTTVDSSTNVGIYTSITIGTDGFPVISYQNANNGYLKVTKCGNASCSTACGSGGTVCTTLDSSGSVDSQTSIILGTDGYPVIAYYDDSIGALKVAKCSNASCSSSCNVPGGTVCLPLDNSPSVGQFASMTTGVDGFPIIAYYDSSNGDLKVAKCNNSYCTSNWSRR